MNADFTPEDLAFRDEVREFLQNEFPAEMREKVDAGIRLSKDEIVRWQKILYEQGWAAPNWPVEFGGTGWTATQKHIFAMEMGLIGAPEPVPFGMKMVAPVLMAYGSEEQQQRFLPDILQSNVWWCQGYSEPNSGSDLASLKTSAVRDGDDYIVNGSKTWNTYGQYADWIFCLVRTDTTVKKQEGISFLLIDMKSPGVSHRPIVLMDGHVEVNEIFFDDVRVPAANLIGEENKGWTYAKVLLTHERTNIALVPRSTRRLRALRRAAASLDDGYGGSMLDDPVFSHRFAELEIELKALEYTELRTLASLSVGKSPGPESSILKVVGTELAQRIDEMFVELAAYHSLPYLPEQFDEGFQGAPLEPGIPAGQGLVYLNNRKLSIFGGSNEIQRNIICKAVLGL
ncbi:MAG: pimeloyl-CoA dehydrogenase large subunit [Gammaproteobacteria bacterium]|nr:pimeloyl-CoA dehydrogenase large subunit [Gammaproteobacteria bacterium]MYA66415.1 pimeloyl-CoA dehydrogenase large subunit [Gammaproteobacteria bacterium]MYC60309.1 pimeloyl-CoA dehydrogenase large subunit [Gammaproteobacteria bacterium]MYE30993.1 pimeloyl-CoA dehydrogenase large subunit [Gammaproteobacteria bacterium]MYH47644.1 pimeloyl-CoA dehydrogenase large subunit [Gammaproteobacteria bacterium]